MSCKELVIAGSMLVPLALWLSGCGKSAPLTAQPPTVDATPADTDALHEHHEHDAHDHLAQAEDGGHDAEIETALAALSPDDRALAEGQAICPVTSEKLGTMGTPLKIEAAGESVFLCCEGCKETLLKEPKKYLAKLKK